MLRRFIFFLIILISYAGEARASHLMGGEITWDCAGGGNYIFTLRLYRDCNGSPISGVVALSVFNHPTISSIPLTLLSQTDISPGCNASGPAISCSAAEAQPGWPASPSTIAGAVQESVFQSAPIALPGTPPAAGWIFTYDDCCRNPAITNLQSPGGIGFTLRAVMYAFNGQNANPCFDSSPRFAESPGTIICTGYPFTYNHNAFDPEGDSLYYDWATPLTDFSGAYNPPVNPTPVTFAPGYSYTSPLPGTAQDPSNIPASINHFTGEISFTSYTQGNFVTVVKVSAFRCGQLVAEIYREIQIVLLPCASNNPPTVTYTAYQDTVYAGALINFTITGTDNGLLSDGITPQSVSILANGNEFGSGFTSTTTGCSKPPCATLTPVSPATGVTTVSAVFSWQTSCNHLANNSACNPHSNTYNFVFKTKDDFCPAPAENISTVSITVLALPVVESPFLHCASVLPSGDVVLNWSPPADTAGTFNAYLVYSASSVAGPYALIDSIFSLATSTYTDVGAGANAAPVYYYIVTRSGCGIITPAADTIASMHLNVANPGNGTAVLTWNPLSTPLPAGASGIYNVYMEYPAGNWTLAATTSSSPFIDSVYVCNATVNFRVEMQDASGCTSVSSIAGGSFANTIVPDIPVFDSVSVDDNNLAQVSWNASLADDVEAYIIYYFNGISWVPVDTVYGINTTYYYDLSSTPGNASDDYRLAALDSCGNISPLGPVQSTIFLSSSADVCNRTAILSWSSTTIFGAGLSGFRIYQSTVSAAGPWTLLGSTAPGILTFSATGLAPSTMYYYKVTAFSSDGRTESSNRISFYSAIPIPPAFSYLRKVSVTDPDMVEVSCHVDIAASTLRYKVMRSKDTVSTHYVLAGTIPAAGITPVTFTDHNVLTDKFSYYYKIINVDSCGYDGLETNLGRTILLTVLGNSSGLYNTLHWNDYEDWSGNVTSYNIYRGIDSVFDPVPVANVPFTGSDSNTYVDDISTMLQGHGVFSYYVEAIEGMGNIYGFSENSTSNVAEAYQEPMVFVPNAFSPNGVNNVFIPVMTFVNISDYELDIFNRWGLNVFTSKDMYTGWDGMHSGHLSEGGVYVYLLRFRTARGEYIERKGPVTLIR